MGVWLIQTGQRIAHLYGDSDDDTVAACGHLLEDYCEHCDRALDTNPAADRHEKCRRCSTQVTPRSPK